MRIFQSLSQKHRLIIAAVVSALALVPMAFDRYIMSILTQYFLYTLMGVAWSVLGGLGNLVSLGHAMFFGFGSYSVALLSVHYGINPIVGTFLGILLAALMSSGFVWISVRYSVMGMYFAGMTLVTAETVRHLANNLAFTGRSQGLVVRIDDFFGLPGVPATESLMYYGALFFAVVGVMSLVWIRRSRLGYELMALREEHEAARMVGIRHARVKFTAGLISGAITAFAGAYHVQLVRFVEPAQDFGLEISLMLLFAAFLGGRSHPFGAAVGMAVLFLLREGLVNLIGSNSQEIHALIQVFFGSALLVTAIAMPDGVMGAAERARYRLGRRSEPTVVKAEVDVPSEHAPSIIAAGPIRMSATAAGPLQLLRVRSGQHVLRVENVVKRFGGLVAVNQVTMEVPPGEALGLIGPNGSGKTTLCNIIAGTYRPDSGNILLGDRPITGAPPELVNRLGIARTYQIPRPFMGMTVYENVLVAAWEHHASRAIVDAVVREVLRLVQMDHKMDEPCSSLQLSEIRRVEIARAVCTGPGVLICDEAMSGLSDTERDGIVHLLRQVNRELGVSLIVVEHILPVVRALCERLVVLDYGGKIAEGSPDEVLRNPDVVRAYVGGVA